MPKRYEIRESANSHVEEPVIAYGSTSQRYSYADYLSWLDDRVREIINGVVRLMPYAATTTHARISLNIAYEFETHIRKRKGKCQVFVAPFDVRLPKNGETADDKIDTVVQPDICVICDLSKIEERGCLGAPDLIVEVQSPSTSMYDLTKKFQAYEEAGVREYWVVFPKTNSIKIFRLQENGKYDKEEVFTLESTIHSKVLEGFELDLKEVFFSD